MADNVTPLKPRLVGEGYRFNGDELLEAAKGEDFATLVIIGDYGDGEMWISGSANAGESLVLLERAKHKLVFPGA